jgi:hypothetical protein
MREGTVRSTLKMGQLRPQGQVAVGETVQEIVWEIKVRFLSTQLNPWLLIIDWLVAEADSHSASSTYIVRDELCIASILSKTR